MLKDAQKVLNDAVDRFEYELMDVQEIPYAHDSFDIVIANLMLYHIPNRKKTIAEISRVLKPESIRYILCQNLWNKRHERIE